MTELPASLREAFSKARAYDPRPEAVDLWNEIEQAVGASDDPAGALSATMALICEEFSRARDENTKEIRRIAASLGAEIVEVDPANKPASLKNTEVHGWYTNDPTPQLIFPADQPLYRRLAAARKIAATLKAAA